MSLKRLNVDGVLVHDGSGLRRTDIGPARPASKFKPSPYSMKRKREELDDSDDDEPAYGKQILPVANLPQDFDEEPVDGLQYLFTVRYVNLSLTNLFILKSYLGEMPVNYLM